MTRRKSKDSKPDEAKKQAEVPAPLPGMDKSPEDNITPIPDPVRPNPFLYVAENPEIESMRAAFVLAAPTLEQIRANQEVEAKTPNPGSLDQLGFSVPLGTPVERDEGKVLQLTPRVDHDLLTSLGGPTSSIGSGDPETRDSSRSMEPRDDREIAALIAPVPKDDPALLPRCSLPSYTTEPNVFGLSAGLYLLGAATGKGKTVHSLAMYVRLLHDRDTGVNKVRYLYMYEPGANFQWSFSAEAGVAPSPVFQAEQPQFFARDLKGYISSDGAAPGKIFILDSVTRVYRNFLDSAALKQIGSATFPGGLQAADVAAIAALDGYAQQQKITIVATVNNEVVPFGDVLEAACQGRIELVRFGTIRVKDRVNARQWREHKFTSSELYAALDLITPNQKADK